jgi:hypothetical protein
MEKLPNIIRSKEQLKDERLLQNNKKNLKKGLYYNYLLYGYVKLSGQGKFEVLSNSVTGDLLHEPFLDRK